ncbi:hypothetical protein EVAR_33645_1 [Eumeta japonica]|uniref:Uncharacterized protein n=1 Tax=Eumeta variegata TaxID=151549 RepID=A0A4C1VNT5_EUMVA|nr:hypothetical protein EVAR_33645_1 [Eumeta japonica]
MDQSEALDARQRDAYEIYYGATLEKLSSPSTLIEKRARAYNISKKKKTGNERFLTGGKSRKRSKLVTSALASALKRKDKGASTILPITSERGARASFYFSSRRFANLLLVYLAPFVEF